MTNIEVIETEVVPAEVRIPIAKPSGWMAFYCPSSSMPPYWMQVIPEIVQGTVRDVYRCPYPLFTTKDEAVEQAMKSMSNGGTVKVFKIEL